MKIVIAGGHGQIAMLMHPLLVERGHSVGGLIRNPTQEAAVRKAGAEPVICDLEAEGDISDAVGEADAVIFAAGAGPGSGAARKTTMDRDGANKLIEAARRNGVQRYIMISCWLETVVNPRVRTRTLQDYRLNLGYVRPILENPRLDQISTRAGSRAATRRNLIYVAIVCSICIRYVIETTLKKSLDAPKA